MKELEIKQRHIIKFFKKIKAYFFINKIIIKKENGQVKKHSRSFIIRGGIKLSKLVL